MPNRRPQAVEKPSPKKSLAEFLRPQPQESNQNPSFPGTGASEMTLLMAEGVTFLQENEPLPPCSLSRKSGEAAIATDSRAGNRAAVFDRGKNARPWRGLPF